MGGGEALEGRGEPAGDDVAPLHEAPLHEAPLNEAPRYEAPRYGAAPRRARREPDADDLRQRDLVAFMARGLVDHPEDVAVEILEAGSDASYELHVHPDDLGHVIGKQGRTARSMRLALSAAAACINRRADLEIAD